MATVFLNLIIKLFLGLSLFLLFSFNSHWLIKVEGGVYKDEHQSLELNYHTFHVSSLLPATDEDSCNSSPKGQRKGNSLEVRHKHGPCSTLEVDPPSHMENLEHDEERVISIRKKLRPKLLDVDSMKLNKVPEKQGVKQELVSLPVKDGSTIGSASYIVTIGLGTPKKDLSLVFDTASDLTWTQCAPCKKTCYKQKDPLFNPKKSSTYSNISCKSTQCSKVAAATGILPSCESTTCMYGIIYGDSSITTGLFAKDTLSLGSNVGVPNFYFGCGQNNEGLFSGAAGLLGLGRNQLSATFQFAYKFGKYFSYCLPSIASFTGHLTFGKGGTYSKSITYTPLLSNKAAPSFYFTTLQGLTVGGRKLSISPSVFSKGGTIIDSATVITRLPPDAYSALRGAFRKGMSKYPKAPALSILDTCFDLSNYTTVTVPTIGLLFDGGAKVVLLSTGIFYAQSASQFCLAFAPNSDPSEVGIIGNVQQLTFDIVYDVAGGKLGFGPGGCR